MYKLPSILLIALSFAITTDEVYDNSWALIVGINNYENVQDLNYAVEDALAIKNLLINNYHFPRSNVRVLTDLEATQGKIKKELSNLVKYAGKKDRIIFFFSFATFIKYGRFVISPEGTLKYFIFNVLRKSIDCRSNGVDRNSIFFLLQYFLIFLERFRICLECRSEILMKC